MRFVSCITAACLLLVAGPASAEWFADVYAGKSFTEDSDVTVHSGPGQSVFRDVDLDRSLVDTLAVGGRFGRYFDAVPFVGLGADILYFSAPIASQATRVDGCVPSGGCAGGEGNPKRINVDSLAISVDLMLRLPLMRTKTAPYGALQPYVAAGVPLEQALEAASTVPARVLGLPHLGRLFPGGPADVTVIDDRLEVVRAIVGGETRVAG